VSGNPFKLGSCYCLEAKFYDYLASSEVRKKLSSKLVTIKLRLLRKCTFVSFMSCDENLTKTYKARLVKHVMCRLIKTDHVTRKLEKCTYEASVTVTSFEDNFFLTSLEAR
jgi:hypothetical protein